MGDTTRDRCEVYKCVDDGDGFVLLLEERVNCPAFDAENCLKMGVSAFKLIFWNYLKS